MIAQGTTLGPYRIADQIGAGGMGEVYRATDTRLDRTVAIKVLPGEMAADPARRERFEREARAVSSLNHPHICTLHDIGEQDGTHFLVMELVEGQTLAARLEKGRLPLDQALEYGIQIADALDKAHQRGVIHRDLKPGNIMLTRSGVKLLDFGLAKLTGGEASVSPLSQMPTEATTPLTGEGTILGTLQYMAPEQLEGKDADPRTDIFAFGAVLYEMVTGRKVFEGESQASLIGAIMNSDPTPVCQLQPVSPGSLERTLSACLAKAPGDRWQSAHDLAFRLSEIHTGEEPRREAGPATVRRTVWTAIAAGFGGAAIVALVVVAAGALEPAPSTEWFTILPPNGTLGIAPEPVVSPDEQSVAFRAVNASGDVTLWVKPFGAAAARELPGTEGVMLPFWSFDGRAIGYFTEGDAPRVMRIGMEGNEPPQELMPAETPKGADWNRDGQVLVAPLWGGPVFLIPESGGLPEQVTFPGENINHLHPQFLPDGRRFLFFEWDRNGDDRFTLNVGSLDSRDVLELGEYRSQAIFAEGYLLYGQRDELYARRFDPDRLTFEGPAQRIATGLGRSGTENSHAAFDVVGDTIVLANGYWTPQTQWVEMDREGRIVRTIGRPGYIAGFEVSPDEETALLTAWSPEDNATNVYLAKVDSGETEKLTACDWYCGWARWSPGGDEFVYWADGLLLQRLGQRTPTPLLDYLGAPWDWASNGERIISMARLGALGSAGDLGLIEMAGTELQLIPYLESSFTDVEARIAPNSQWVAYTSNEDGEFAVYTDSFPVASNKRRVGVGHLPMWQADGRRLYFLSPGNDLMTVNVTASGATLELSTPEPLFEGPRLMDDRRPQYAVLDNGERFIFNAISDTADPVAITVIRNWKALMER